MSTTTLTAFWQGFTSTTIESILGNWEFFGIILITCIGIFCFGSLFLAMINFFRKRKR